MAYRVKENDFRTDNDGSPKPILLDIQVELDPTKWDNEMDMTEEINFIKSECEELGDVKNFKWV